MIKLFNQESTEKSVIGINKKKWVLFQILVYGVAYYLIDSYRIFGGRNRLILQRKHESHTK